MRNDSTMKPGKRKTVSRSIFKTRKREIHGKKVMLCVWWDQKGIIYYELLKHKKAVNANLYS